VIRDFGQASLNARAAGCDGIELHAANGYLPNQFLSPNTESKNRCLRRHIERRSRFVLEAYDALPLRGPADASECASAPAGRSMAIFDSDPARNPRLPCERTRQAQGAYLHVSGRTTFEPAAQRFDAWAVLKEAFRRRMIAMAG